MDPEYKWVECHDNQHHIFDEEPDDDGTYTSKCGEQFIDQGLVDNVDFYECSIDEIYNGCDTCIRLADRCACV